MYIEEVSMNTATAHTPAPYSIVMLGYSKSDFEHVAKLVNQAGVGKSIKVYVGDLAKYHNLDCDMVMVAVGAGADVGKYVKRVGELRRHGGADVTFLCVAHDKDRAVIEGAKGKLGADEIIYLPTAQEQFAAVLGKYISGGHHSAAAGGPLKLGDLLVKNGLITEENLETALEHQKKTEQRLGDALIDLGLITEEQKIFCLASQLKVQIATARQYASIDLNVAALIPEHMAKRFCCLALEKNDKELIVVMTDVLDLKMLDTIRDAADMLIVPVLGKKEDIETSIERCYRDISSHNEATQFAESMEREEIEVVKKKEDDIDLEQATAAGAELGIIKLVNILIANAVRDKASDIHIEPQENEVIVRYRIDGDMRKVMSPPKRSHHAIVARIKILSNLNIAERRLPQDGRMMVKIGYREIDIRVSILPTIFGEKAVLRILDKEAFEKSTSNLGFTPYDEKIFRTQIAKPYGIIIVTGPTGSGKSTTLYSALQLVKDVTKNVITVEDPVEFHMEGINQVHVNTAIGLTFGSALRSILRQDPDVILIGEIRDNETADIAIKMALTGHLVFSTLHTNDAASSIARFVDIGIPPLLLGSSLNLIIAQRLVRRICAKCKTEYAPEAELLENLNLSREQVPRLYRGTGCVACNGTGYSGRIAIFEMLEISREIRKLILRNAPTMDIQDLAEKEGMKTLRKAGIELALNGVTTIEQVIAATIEI
jgi:type IV pilus assembly protein PilB